KKENGVCSACMVLVTRALPPPVVFLRLELELPPALPNRFGSLSDPKAGSLPSGTRCVPAPFSACAASALLVLLPAFPVNGESLPPVVARRRDSLAEHPSIPARLRQMCSGSKRRAHRLAMR